MQFARQLKDGENIPRGYGFGRWDLKTQNVVAYPLGFNLLVGLWIAIQTALVHGIQSRDQAYTYKLGAMEGLKNGIDIGFARGRSKGYMEGYAAASEPEPGDDTVTQGPDVG